MTSWDEMSKLIDRFGSEGNAAARIRRLRESKVDEKGRPWSQEELARRMTAAGFPMSHTSIWKIENPNKKSGGRAIPIGEAVGFARVLDVTLAELLLPEDAIRDVEVWRRFTAAAEALNEFRHAWNVYRDAMDVVRHAVADSPELARRIASYRDDADLHARRQSADQYILDADNDQDERFRKRVVRKSFPDLPAEALTYYQRTSAVHAADDALSPHRLPTWIIDELQAWADRVPASSVKEA